jgi:hypothetical protein
MNSHLNPMVVAGPAAVFGVPTGRVVVGIPAFPSH